MAVSGRHRHKDSRGIWVTSLAGEHGHSEVTELEKRVTALEPPIPPPPPPPDPEDPPPGPAEPPAAGSLFDVLAAAKPGAVIDLGTREYTAGAEIRKPITLLNGVVKQGATALRIFADDVVLDRVGFVGGRDTIVLMPGSRRTLRRCPMTLMTETSIRLVPGAHSTLIEEPIIAQSIGAGYSPIGANDQGAGVGTFQGLIVRGGTIDNGPPIVSHFGVEVWGVSGLVIEDVDFKGSDVHISIPRSDGAIIRRCNFDLRQTPWAAIELSDIENASVLDCTGIGAGPNGPMWNAFVQLHPGSGAVRNITIQRNRLRDFAALVNAAGDGHHVTDNRLTNVPRVHWGSYTGTEEARNGPNDGPAW